MVRAGFRFFLRMRILFLVSSMKAGGAERVASILANAWAAGGHEVVLMMTYSGPTACEFALHPAVQLKRLIELPRSPGSRPPRAILKALRLRRYMSAKQPDVILSFLTNVNVMALLAGVGLGIKCVIAERVSNAADVELSSALKLLRRFSYPLAERLVVQTARAAQELDSVRTPRVSVIPNPLPDDLARPDARARYRARSGGAPRVVAMGRLTQQKRFDLAISAFASTAVKHSEWELWIWGDGPLRANLQQRIDNTNCRDRIFLRGTTARAWEELADADLFVSTSDYEGFPNAMLEAMALELPCIATDCPSGPADLAGAERDRARLVPLGDSIALAKAMDELMSDRSLRALLGARAADSVRNRFSIAKVMPLWNRAIGVS
jgi:glycosyltransferase involved in cell wall biosynthesis